MSRILRALAYLSPSAAVSRAAALDALRAYEGAARGRRATSFGSSSTSANAELTRGLRPLRDRSRDLVRNTSTGARVLDILSGHVVGTGIQVTWNTGSDAADRLLKEAWEEWSRSADIEGVLDFAGLQNLAIRSMFEGGEAVLQMVTRRMNQGRRVPLALKLYEGDFIDETRDGPTPDGGRARLGVGLGEFDARTGLWINSSHPGEGSILFGRSTFVPRRELVHLYRPLRAGQVRGVPIFAPVMMSARDLADLQDALVVKARVEACQAVIVTKPEGTGTIAGAKQDDGTTLEKVRPGSFLYLNPGETATAFNPANGGGHDQVVIQTLMSIAAGTMVTYDQLTGDLRQANYSSLRAGKIEFRRLVEQVQWLNVVPMMLDPIVSRWLELARLAISGIPERAAYTCVTPAVEPIDPKKDLEADILAVRAGRLTPQEFISSWGRDWREVVEDTAAFLDAIDAKGLVLDIDPRKVSAAGIMQPDTKPANTDNAP